MRRYKKISEKDKIKYTQILCELINRETKTHLIFTNDFNSECLIRVMDKFPKFVEELPELVCHKIIIFDNINFKFKWNRDKTSIAQYFGNMKKKSLCTCGDFWADIEEAFEYERKSLKPLNSDNGGIRKPSKDYEEIMRLFPEVNKEEMKYMEKISALEDMFNENSVNYFWKDDGTEIAIVDWCKTKFANIEKIVKEENK